MNNLKICASALIMMAAASLQCFAQTTSIDKNGSLRTIKFQYYMFRITIILAMLFALTQKNQAQDFTSSLHVPRVGDKLQVEQVGFVLSGGSGTGQRWDFSRLDVIRPKHRISYVGEYDSSVFTEIEDMTMTYYSVRGDTLLLTGFESNTKEMCYANPELSMRFPLTLGDSIGGYIHGCGVFSDKLLTQVYGRCLCETDASGSMLLPSGDVLRDVIRVHTHRTVGGKEIAAGDGQDIRALKNNILSCAADSIEHFLSADTAQTVVDTYRWFAAGYRYPILRTVRVSDTDGNTLSLAAYYFSPERQSELSDPDNERIRRQQQDDSGETDANGKESVKTDCPIDYSVNVSGHSITIDYSLRATANVRALLCDVRGMVYKSHTAANPAGSDYCFTLDCTGLRAGEYVLYLNVNGVVSSGKVRLQ